MIVSCKREGKELEIRERCYEKVLVPKITKQFILDDLVTQLTDVSNHFAPAY